GVGSRFEILLPRSSDAGPAHKPKVEPQEMVGGSERILVTEDDPAVLSLTVDLLRGLGYSVVTASSGEEALRIVRADPALQLLFTDVVMPGGLSGIALARACRQERPDLPVLLTSGFIGDPELLRRDEFALLDKPYPAEALAARLRSIFDQPAVVS